MPRKAPIPVHTQAPNIFYDEWLKEINSLAELKVVEVVIRNTFGWHYDRVKMSLTDIKEATGLSKSSAQEGVKRAVNDGYIARVPNGRTFAYEIPLDVPESGTSEISRDIPEFSTRSYRIPVHQNSAHILERAPAQASLSSDLKEKNISIANTQDSAPPQKPENPRPGSKAFSSPKPHSAARRPRQKQYPGRVAPEPAPLPSDWDLTAWHYAWAEKNTPALLAMMATIAGQYKSTALANKWDSRYLVDPNDTDAKWIAYMWGALRIEQRRPGFTPEPPPEWRKTTIDGTKLMKDGKWLVDNRQSRYPQVA